MKTISYYFLGQLSLTALVLATQVSGHPPRATYGEPCSRTNRCDSRAFLTCNNGSCGCMRSDVMTFDGTRCVVLAGEKCSFTAVDVQDGIEERSWREELSCVANSDCQDGYCSCHPTFFENSTGLCLPKRDYHGDCEFDQACKKEEGLICTEDRRCDCNSTTTIYDHHVRRCATKAGQSCMNNQACVSDAECSYRVQTRDRVCTCNAFFFNNPMGECETKRGYNASCENNDYCLDENVYRISKDISGFTCTENKRCDCDPSTSIFDNDRRYCVAIVGQSCNVDDNCVSNAMCQYGDYSDVCVCRDGHFRNPRGECEANRGYNETCENNNYCQHSDNQRELQLVCNPDGACGCNSTTSKLDLSQQFCVGLAGADCSDFPACAENSECHVESNGSETQHRCRCLFGYFQTADNLCQKKVGCGGACEADKNCKDFMKCGSNGTCECDSLNRVYDSITDSCLGLVNASCNYGNQCVANSECVSGLCSCVKGYATSKNETCLVSHSEKCGIDWTKSCNEAQGLVCIGGVCVCKYENFQKFDFSVGKCVSSVPGPCDDSIPCVANAHCSNPNGTIRQCKCNTGFVPVNGECLLGIGQPCDYEFNKYNDDNRLRFGSAVCDVLAPLRCIQGICQCGSLEEYDNVTGKCQGLVGSGCTDGYIGREYCTKNAECVETRVFGRSEIRVGGTCNCKTGMLTTDEKRCVIDVTAKRLGSFEYDE